MPVKRALLIVMIIATYNTPVFSCSTPVFRYALEMWGAYSYVIEVYHDGNLDDTQQQALDYLKDAYGKVGSANIKVIEVTNNYPNDIKKDDFPLMRLSFPTEHKIPAVVWQGALNAENASYVVDSPARKQVLNNITRGDAAVWLFLPSGNKEKDARQLKVLQEELSRLSNTMKLAEDATDVAGNVLDIELINIGVDFSLVEIDRNDPAEEIFIKILLGTESDLKVFQHIPLAFPVFGQGRVLYALVGNGINSKNLETACSTIIGWCSCTIKDDNPGTDLLLKGDWDSIAGDSSWIKKEETPDITGLAGFLPEDDAETSVDPDAEGMKADVATIAEAVTETEGEEVKIEPYTYEERISSPNTSEDKTDVLVSAIDSADQTNGISPLLRNSLIAAALFLVVMFSTAFILKKK